MQKDKKEKAPQGESYYAYLSEANIIMNVDNDDFLNVDVEDLKDNE